MTEAAAPALGPDGGLPLKVRNVTLLAILITTPAAALLAIIDQLFLDGRVQNHMDVDPGRIAYWVAVLTIPHIVASLVTFIDREYVSHYRRQLGRGVIIAAIIGIALPVAMGPEALLIAMTFYTMYHNLMQQYGLSLMMMRQPPTRDFQFWRWLTILPAGLAFMVLTGQEVPWIGDYYEIWITLCGLCLPIATIFGIRFFMTINRNPDAPRIGKIYFATNCAMLYVCFALIISGYGLLATLVPRIIHDLTAFWIYTVHDQNRNARDVRNPVYYIPKKIGIPPALLCMPLSIGISYLLLETFQNILWVSAFVTFINFLHYYMEGHMWKRGTPHRQHVPFV